MSYEDTLKVLHYWYDLHFGPWEIAVIFKMPLTEVVETIEELHARGIAYREAYNKLVSEAVLLNASYLERSLYGTKEEMN